MWGLRYGSTTLALTQYEGSTTPFGSSKYSTAQTTFRQKSDNLDYIYIWNRQTYDVLIPRRFYVLLHTFPSAFCSVSSGILCTRIPTPHTL